MRHLVGLQRPTIDPVESVHVSVAVEELAPFYTEDEARLWLATPQPLLNYRCPLEMLAERKGRRTVFALIARLRDCIYV
jgi:uncharacterized protein (DUF2384 family)